jgi:hypothetical protein
MANYERDKDDARVFDGGDDDDAEGSHLPVVIIIAILVLAAFGGVVWLAYNQGLARGRSDVPVQVASNDSAKGGQLKVYQQPAGADDEEDVQTVTGNSQTGEPASPKSVATAPAPDAGTSAPASTPATVAPKFTAATPKPAPVAVALRPSTTGTPAATAQSKPVASAPKPATKVAQAATLPTSTVKPQYLPPATATKPPAQLGLAHPAEPATTSPAKSAATPKPVAAVAPRPVAVATGSYLLQIGAYKSQDEAMTAWKTYQAKHASLLKSYSPDVQRADLGDKGIWYRLRVSSFADKSSANALCDKLKAENGACFLAR